MLADRPNEPLELLAAERSQKVRGGDVGGSQIAARIRRCFDKIAGATAYISISKASGRQFALPMLAKLSNRKIAQIPGDDDRRAGYSASNHEIARASGAVFG